MGMGEVKNRMPRRYKNAKKIMKYALYTLLIKYAFKFSLDP